MAHGQTENHLLPKTIQLIQKSIPWTVIQNKAVHPKVIQLSFVKAILFPFDFPSFAVKIHNTGHKVIKGMTVSVGIWHE